jgi:short-subunit dehydrogenase
MTPGTRPIALVTGASSGIGAALARKLAEAGHDLVLVARRQDRLTQLADTLGTVGARSEILVADLSDREGLHRAAERASAGDVEILVSNAGVSAYERLDHLATEEVEAAWTLNADATPLLARAVLPAMIANGRGGIIATASTLAFSSGLTELEFGNGQSHRLPHRSLYVAAKAGLVAFIRSLAQELEGTGVNATVVCPGLVSSEWNGGASRLPTAMTPDDVATATWAAHNSRETVCFPGLDDLDPWNTLAGAEKTILEGNNRSDLASRYR